MKKLIFLLLANLSLANDNNNYLLGGIGITPDMAPVVSAYYGHNIYKFNDVVSINGELNGSWVLYSSILSHYYRYDCNGAYINLSDFTKNNVLLSAVPMFNFNLTNNLSLDAGIGLGYMTTDAISFNDAFRHGSNLNFSLNTGLRYDYNSFVTMLRFQHLSNGGTVLPNFGINTFTINFGVKF